jgi:hypothetical protein
VTKVLTRVSFVRIKNVLAPREKKEKEAAKV